MKFKHGISALIAGLILATPHAIADEKKDLQVIGRALSFVEGGATGDVNVAIVYADDIASSKAEAEKLAGLMEGGFSAGKVKLIPTLVEISQLGSASGAGALFITSGMSAHYGAISATKQFTTTTDNACVEAGACVVYVQGAPKVEIIVNRAAADAASIAFTAAFRMMIKEI